MQIIKISTEFFNQEIFFEKFKNNSLSNFELELLYNGFYGCDFEHAIPICDKYKIDEDIYEQVVCFDPEWYPEQPKFSFYQNSDSKIFETDNRFFQIDLIQRTRKNEINKYTIYEVEPVDVEIRSFSPKGSDIIKLSKELEKVDYQEI